MDLNNVSSTQKITSIILIIAILFVSVFIIYKTTIDISNKKTEQFDYNLSTNNYNNYNNFLSIHTLTYK